jgi:8-amino-7-oxononanoate synthase
VSDAKGRGSELPVNVKELLIRKALERRNKKTEPSTQGTGHLNAAADRLRRAIGGISENDCRFDRFPAYQRLKAQMLAVEKLRLTNPFFRVHDGTPGSRTVVDGRSCLNFASYDYLGLNGHPAVRKAAHEAIDRYGTSVSASRQVSGERPVQRDLEQTLAAIHGVDAALAFVSGHATNVTTIGNLFEPQDVVFHDALAHNSILDGIRLSGAHRVPFPHNDWEALDRKLAQLRGSHKRALVVIEGLYSMDGDIPDLPAFVDVKRRHRAFLMVDEAHSLGVLGSRGFGIAEHAGVDPKEVDIWMGTLSKTQAASGGYIAGERVLIDLLRVQASGFFYSVGIAPPMAAAALEALRVMQAEPERVARLQSNGRLFLDLARERGINTGKSRGYSVVPALVGSSIKTVRLANALFERGVVMQPVVHPAVEEGMARLRFFISSLHDEQQIRTAVTWLAEELSRVSA